MKPCAAAVAVMLGLAGCQSAGRPEKVFDEFRGADWRPRMVVIDGGEFLMGAPEDEPGRYPDELLPRRVRVAAFALAQTETTFAQWMACVGAGACNGYVPADFAKGREPHPVVNISWRDAQAYVEWLSARTGERYRLPTDAEWEFAARAGVSAAYPWGAHPDRALANYGADECCAGAAEGEDVWVESAPVGSFPPNAFGLYDLHGNVWEWTADCYSGAEAASACEHRTLRGGSWLFPPHAMRSAARRRHDADARTGALGFRVARDLDAR